jgi:hypothetical protein
MSIAGISNKSNTVAVVVREGGGVEILSNGKKIFPAGGPDNNPIGAVITQLGQALGQTEHIENAQDKAVFQSALSGQMAHVMALQVPSGNHHFPNCSQMQKEIDELRQRAARTTDPTQRQHLNDLITSDQKVVDAICHKGPFPGA